MYRMKNFIKNRPLISLVVAFQIFRFLLLPFVGIMPQDAYYYFYGQHLALSYLDHPGMIGYILRLFTDLFGSSVFVLKLADFSISTLTLIAFYRLATLFLSKSKRLIAFVLLGSSVMLSILSINSTPDVPLLLFWTLAIIALHKAIFFDEFKQWLWAGLFMGLAFDSKYTGIFLQFGLIAFLILSKDQRKLLFSKGLFSALVLSVLVAFPVIYWNYQHNFVSFLFQSTQRAEDVKSFGLKPISFLGTIGHQMFILLPFLFVFTVIITFRYLKKYLLRWQLPDSKILFLLCFFLPTFLGFYAISLFYWVKLNWLMPGYITGIIFVSFFITRKWIKWNLLFSVFIHLLLAVEIIFYIVPVKSDDTWFGWEKLAKGITEIQRQHPDTFIFSDDNYKTTAVLNFYLDQKVYAQNIIGKFALQFDFIGDDLTVLNGKNALFIDSDKRCKNDDKSSQIPEDIKPFFRNVIQLEPIIIKHHGKTVRKFWVYYATDYHNKPFQ